MGDGVVVIGGGGHAKVVLSMLIELRMKIEGIYDDDPRKWGQYLCGVKITGPISNLENTVQTRAVMGIGDNITRAEIAGRFGNVHWVSAIHPHAFVHPSATIGEGTVVFAGTVIQPDTAIGKHCIINTNATIDHDCTIGDNSHIGPGTCLAGGVSIGDGSFLGVGTVAIMGVNIGKWSVVGAGGVVIRDIPDNVTAIGVPARVVKQIHGLR